MLQRWAILLSAYDYDVQCHSTSHHNNDNILSHLHLATPANRAVLLEQTIFNVRQIDSLPLTVLVTCYYLY